MTKHFTISCEDDVHDWLSGHPEINKSGAFQLLIKYMMRTGRVVISESDLEHLTADSFQKTTQSACEQEASQ